MPEESGDTRVLNMRVNNKQFLKGTAESLKALDVLNRGIDKITGTNSGVKEMGGAIDTVKNKFSALQVVGVTALATIANKAVNAGLSLVKSLTIAPVMQGFREYEKILTTTQTIVSNTGVKVKTANKYLGELNTYSDKTIYNFAQMAENVARFTAAVDPKKTKLPTVVQAIKGLANVAALAGANNEQLGRAMYQMSQAMGESSIMLRDWVSLTQAGMGSQQLQNAFKATAMTIGDHGKAMQAAFKEHKTFRASLKEGWLTIPVFNKTLKVMAGQLVASTTPLKKLKEQGFDQTAIASIRAGRYVAYSTKQLKEMGYTAPGVAEELNKLSGNAIKSATEIKTFTQLMGVIRESVASGVGRLFMAVMGDYEEAKDMWTDVGDVATAAVTKMFDATEKILGRWQDLGGFEKLWAGVGNVMKSVGNLMAPLVMAFHAIFPGIKNTGDLLYKLTKGFYDFSVWLEKGTRGAAAFGPVLEGLGAAIAFPFRVFMGFKDALEDVFKNFDLAGGLEKLAGMFERVGDAISRAFSPEKADLSLDALNAVLIGGIFFTVKNFSDRLNELLTGGLFGDKGGLRKVTDSFRALTDALQSMQTLIRAKTIREIAVSVALLAGAMLLLSVIDPKRLKSGLTTMAIIFAQLLLAMGILIKMSKTAGFVKIPMMAASLMLFSGAILILSAALKVMSTLSWEEIARGLTALAGVLAGILAFTALLRGSSVRITALGLAMIPFAIGVTILAGALKIFATMSWDEIGRGMVAFAGVLAGVALSARLMPKSLPFTAAGLVMVGIAVNLMAKAVQTFASMNVKELVKGIIAMNLAIQAIGLAMLGMPLTLPITAAGLVLVSIALQGIVRAVSKLGSMSVTELGKGFGALALGIGALGLALKLFGVSGLLGAVALNLVAVALVLLVPELIALGSMDWQVILTGLGALAGVLLIMGVAGTLAGPAILMVGGAILLLGAGIALAGAGVLAFGAGIYFLVKGIQSFVDMSGEMINSLVTIAQAIIAHIPAISQMLLVALVQVAQAIAERMPEFVASGVRIVMSILQGIRTLFPALIDTALDMIMEFINEIVEHQQEFWDAGFDLLQGFLDTLLDRIPDLIETGTDIVVAVMEGIGDGSDEIVTAAGDMMTQFLNAINDNARDMARDFTDVGLSIAGNILKGIGDGILGKFPKTLQAAAAKVLGIKQSGKKPKENARGTDYFGGGLSWVGELGPELVSMNRGAAVITNKNLVGFMQSVSKLTKAMLRGPGMSQTSSGGTLSLAVSADFKGDPKVNGAAFAANIAEGLAVGLRANQPSVNKSIAQMGAAMSESFAAVLGIKSPSTVFKEFAGDVGRGLILGLLQNVESVRKAAGAMGKAVIEGVAKTITDGQLKLEAQRARSSALKSVIDRLQAKADKYDDPEDADKKEKIEKEIENLKKQADAAEKAAAAQEKLVQEQNAARERLLQFRAADNQQRAEMRKEDAAIAAAKASEQRELALRLKMEANILRKYDAKRAQIIEDKAAIVLKRATTYSDLANKYSKEAFEYAQKVQQEVDAQMQKQLEQVTPQDVADAQAAFEAYLRAVADAEAAAAEDRLPQQVTFEQNNYSPEAISAADAYRNGKSLVSVMERKLVKTP